MGRFRLRSTLLGTLFLFWFFGSAFGQGMVTNGVFRYTGAASVIELRGGWEFYPGRLLSEEKANGPLYPPAFLDVPSQWNDCRLPGEWKKGFGAGTYRVIIDGLTPGARYGIIIPDMFSYRLSIDGSVLLSDGVVGLDAGKFRASAIPSAAFFTAGSNRTDVRIETANYVHNFGGIWQDVRIGTDRVIRKSLTLELIQAAALFGFLVSMGLFHLVLFLLRRKDRSSLYFSMLCFLVAVRCLFIQPQLFFQIFPDADFLVFNRVPFVAISIMVVSFVSYVCNLFPQDVRREAVALVHLVSLIQVFLTVLLPYHEMTSSFIGYQLAVLVICLYILFTAILAWIRRREGARLFLSGYVFLAGIAINDILYGNGVIKTAFLLNWGLAIFVFFQALLIAKKSAKAFRTAEELTLELDNRVNERTSELGKQLRERERILSILSHDLRTPVSALITRLDLMGIALEKGDLSKLSEMLKGAKRRARNSLELMDQLLEWARVNHLFNDKERKMVRLSEIVTNVILMNHEKAEDKQISLIPDVKGGITAWTDPRLVETVLRNLVSNALKFTPPHGEVRISASTQGDFVRMTVSDNGIGMSKELLGNLFYQLQEVRREGIDGEKGAGIGLVLCRELVHMAGGIISVLSEEGKGSEFSFTLPLSAESAEPAGSRM